jgi:hypothetical protein
VKEKILRCHACLDLKVVTHKQFRILSCIYWRNRLQSICHKVLILRHYNTLVLLNECDCSVSWDTRIRNIACLIWSADGAGPLASPLELIVALIWISNVLWPPIIISHIIAYVSHLRRVSNVSIPISVSLTYISVFKLNSISIWREISDILYETS